MSGEHARPTGDSERGRGPGRRPLSLTLPLAALVVLSLLSPGAPAKAGELDGAAEAAQVRPTRTPRPTNTPRPTRPPRTPGDPTPTSTARRTRSRAAVPPQSAA
jgi:hypothetical protein